MTDVAAPKVTSALGVPLPSARRRRGFSVLASSAGAYPLVKVDIDENIGVSITVQDVRMNSESGLTAHSALVSAPDFATAEAAMLLELRKAPYLARLVADAGEASDGVGEAGGAS